jgi:hypothetical protein
VVVHVPDGAGVVALGETTGVGVIEAAADGPADADALADGVASADDTVGGDFDSA